jgi:hypothetical protein
MKQSESNGKHYCPKFLGRQSPDSNFGPIILDQSFWAMVCVKLMLMTACEGREALERSILSQCHRSWDDNFLAIVFARQSKHISIDHQFINSFLEPIPWLIRVFL